MKKLLIAFAMAFVFFSVSAITVLVLYNNSTEGGLLGLDNQNPAPPPNNPNPAQPVQITPPNPIITTPPNDPNPIHTNNIISPIDDVLTVEGFMVNNNELPWNLQLVNRFNFLDDDFEAEVASIGNGHSMDARAAASLLAMLDAARAEGLSSVVRSSYRTVSHQRTLFYNQVQRQRENGLDEEEAFEAALRINAYPGSSEHNLGLAVDIVSLSHGGLTAAFGQTAEGIWLAQNAHRFGFILRYPNHKQHITHIIYEPWHFRYTGEEHATTMFENDWVLEEYIFQLQ